MLISGCVALVTGGAAGIGKAICYMLLQNGAKVCIVDLDDETGRATAAALGDKFGSENIAFIHCDVSKGDDLEAAFDRAAGQFGGLDIVCNNAGVQMDMSNWERVVQTNLVAVIRGSKLALKHMGKKNGGKGGVIINTSSVNACHPFPYFPVYSATKAGVNMFTRAMAEQLGDSQGVRICAVCPGLVDTQMIYKTPDECYDPEALRAALDSYTTMKPEVVSEEVRRLITDDSKNGTLLLILPGGCEEFTQPQIDADKLAN